MQVLKTVLVLKYRESYIPRKIFDKNPEMPEATTGGVL